jgi:hypothetical protein
MSEFMASLFGGWDNGSHFTFLGLRLKFTVKVTSTMSTERIVACEALTHTLIEVFPCDDSP